MKIKKILNKDWMSLHPYKNPDQTDVYYLNLANKVKKAIVEVADGNPYESEETLDELACFLTAWFEDVISQLNIWHTFTTECEKIYGTKLPFYDLSTEYYPEDINVQDIQFLLWYHLQCTFSEKTIADPFSPHISEVAEAVYGIFDAEYETAPENERLQQFLTQDLKEEGRFIGFRNIMMWFHTQCYLSLSISNDLATENAKFMAEQQSMSPTDMAVAVYSATVANVLTLHSNLLGMTTPEWMSHIFVKEPLKSLAAGLKAEEIQEFLIEGEDSDSVHLIQATERGRKRFKLSKKGLDRHSLPKYVKPGFRCLTSIALFDGEYYQNGALLFDDPKPDNAKIIEEANQQEQNDTESNNTLPKTQPDYGFVAATDGKGYTFFGTKEEAKEFFGTKLEDYPMENIQRDVLRAILQPALCIYVEECGIVTMPCANFLDTPGNPYYTKADDNINRVMALFNNYEALPYQVLCKMLKLGLLDSACHQFFKGDELTLRKHNQFIADYFYRRHQ